MRVKSFVCLSIASLILVGCVGAAKNQIADRPTPVMTASAPSSQPTSIAQTMTPTKSTIARSGNFVSGEHPTQGTARIVTQNGKSFVELDQKFQTSSLGPDLVVVLHRSADVLGSTNPPAYPLKSGEYVVLAPLQKFSGAQRYAISTQVNLANYNSVVIWCRRFNATFGSATLNS